MVERPPRPTSSVPEPAEDRTNSYFIGEKLEAQRPYVLPKGHTDWLEGQSRVLSN